MTRPPPRSTRTAPLFPTTTLFRSTAAADPLIPIEAENKRLDLRKACHFPPCSTRRICQAAEFSELCLPWFMGVERTHELVLGTHEVDNGGVVHGVIAALKRDLLDRKSTRLNPVTNAHLVCRLLLEKKNVYKTHKVD